MSAAEIEIDYLEESGPGVVEIKQLPQGQPPAGAPEPAPTYPGWDPEAIEQFLRGTGAGIHMMIGAAEKDWLMTKADLERMAPPLTRICNRWEPALKLSPLADPILFTHGLVLYGWRSALERKRALLDAQDAAAAEGAGAGYVYVEEEPRAAPGPAEPPDEQEIVASRPLFPEAVRPRSPE